MKITREEFKELVELHREAWDNYKIYEEYLNQDLLGELIFPCFDWIGKKIGIYFDEYDIDILTDLTLHNREIAVNYRDGIGPDGKPKILCDYTKDLDLIYDEYIEKRGKKDE